MSYTPEYMLKNRKIDNKYFLLLTEKRGSEKGVPFCAGLGFCDKIMKFCEFNFNLRLSFRSAKYKNEKLDPRKSVCEKSPLES